MATEVKDGYLLKRMDPTWVITGDEVHPGVHSGKPWGVERLSVAEQHYKALIAGVDQFGGNNEKGPVIEVYNMYVRNFGEDVARKRFEA